MNMFDARGMLREKSVRVKVEKRVLKRVEQVMRMGNERIKEAVVLDWYKGILGGQNEDEK